MQTAAWKTLFLFKNIRTEKTAPFFQKELFPILFLILFFLSIPDLPAVPVPQRPDRTHDFPFFESGDPDWPAGSGTLFKEICKHRIQSH